jgi:hypothetical protein
VKRPTSSYVIAITSLILGGIASLQGFYQSFEAGVSGVAIVALVLGVIYAYYVFPAVSVGESKVVIINPLTRHEIGMAAIEDVDTRFALTLKGEFGKVLAWAAPAPSRLRHRSHPKEDFTFMGLKEGQEVRPSDLPSTISGSFALQVRRAMAEKPTDGSYKRSPNWLGILSIALPGIAVLVTQL